MKLYFVRHGESEANLLREFSNRGLKHGLTPRGWVQAETLAEMLHPHGIAHIYTSPLLRARQTAEILADRWHVRWEETDALREYDCGVLEGKSDETSWLRYEELSEAWLMRREWDRRIEEGESFLDIQTRFVPFIERLINAHRDTADVFLLVGHGGTYRCMLPLVLTNVSFEFTCTHPITNTGYILAEHRTQGLICREWCGQAVSFNA